MEVHLLNESGFIRLKLMTFQALAGLWYLEYIIKYYMENNSQGSTRLNIL